MMKSWIGRALLAGFMLAGGARSQAQMVMIVNPQLRVETISRTEIRDVFTGATTSLKNVAHVQPVLLKRGETHNEFLSLYIGVKDSEFRANWMKILFAGKLLLPQSLDSEADVVTYVEQHPTAIGYIRSSTPHKGVTVLVVR